MLFIRDYYILFFFFFNVTATTEIYTLSLHDALPICCFRLVGHGGHGGAVGQVGLHLPRAAAQRAEDRKSTRLNSSHGYISYAVFCLKKKKTTTDIEIYTTPSTTKNLTTARTQYSLHR